MSDLTDQLRQLRGVVVPPTSPLAPNIQQAQDFTTELSRSLRQIDPAVSRAGVPSWTLRYGLSLADTKEERAKFLNDFLGKGQWTQDLYGNYAIKPQAAARFGIQTDKPVLIDEPGLSRYDLADIGADVPAIVGSMAGAAKGAAVGAPGGPLGVAAGGVVGSALGGAAGRGAQEAGEALAGRNIQPLGEVGRAIGGEAVGAGAGELLYQGAMRPIGRYLMAPQARRMTPLTRELVEEGAELGVRPGAGAVTGAPLLRRAQAIMDNIFGDPRVERNAAALRAEMERLKGTLSPKMVSGKEAGTLIKNQVTRSRKALSRWAGVMYGKLDEAVGHQPIVPTANLKIAARELLEQIPQEAGTGTPILADQTFLARLNGIEKLPDQMTLAQAQWLRGFLGDAMEDNTLVPGAGTGALNRLYRAAMRDLDAIVPDDPAQAQNLFGSTDVAAAAKQIISRYKTEIRKFDDALIKRIARDPAYAGAIPPEQVVSLVFRPGRSDDVTRVMSMMKSGTRAKVRRQAMVELMDSYVRRSRDPKVGEIFDGTSLLEKLDRMGKDTLYAMFDRKTVNGLYRLGRATQFATFKGPGDQGALVAAGIAARPLQNLGRLAKLITMARVLETDWGFRWMTEGLKWPPVRGTVSALARLQTRLATMAEEHTQEQQ